MAYSIFLDVNVLVDFFLTDRKNHLDAIEIIRLSEEGTVKSHVSESVINTTGYLVRKSIYFPTYKNAIIELLTFVKVLPCSSTIICNAYMNSKNDLEDAVLYQIALEHRLSHFVTSNVKDFKKIVHPSLQVVNTKEILEII